MKRIAIIPARFGSKRIPQKNIREFCGKPVIAYILESAKKSNLFDVIHVSTDSELIANTVRQFGFSVDFLRPAELADDHTPILPVLKYVYERYLNKGFSFDQVWSLLPTSPFLESKDLIRAEKKYLESGGVSPLLGVSEYQAPIEWAFELNNRGSLIPYMPGKFSIRSQDLQPKYYDTGSFAIFPKKNIEKSDGPGSDDNYKGYILPKYKAIDIDTPDDWRFAEALYEGLFGEKNRN
jgi:pseudaminic acid cytidylyltransferase